MPTLRGVAREAVATQAGEAARLNHLMNYHKLHVLHNGTLNWTEWINPWDDILDARAERFAAIPSVTRVGTGPNACNCPHCNTVYNEIDEQNAKDRGLEYDRDDKYKTYADAIADAVAELDLDDIKDEMLAEFDRIPNGYFDDEQ